jgi:hypothetical protein
MSLFTGKGRVLQYEQVHDLSHLETLTMRSLTLTGAAMLTAALLTGCTGDAAPTAPTAENIVGLTADATDDNVADHFKIVVPGTFDVENPCNGELIILSGEEIDQLTLVGPREVLDAGGFLHMEFQQQVRATGTGLETGATYTLKDMLHENFESPNEPAPHLTFSSHGTSHVTSDLPGLSFDIHSVFHVVIPSGKDFKVTREVQRVTCGG